MADWLDSPWFQSTLPAWGATPIEETPDEQQQVSIHAPRVGSDSPARADPTDPGSFNPRSPRGERRETMSVLSTLLKFQSTLPAWGATPEDERMVRGWMFQSTLPAWGATHPSNPCADSCLVSIHAPRVGSDENGPFAGVHILNVSIHAPRVGSDNGTWILKPGSSKFQSTLPAWGATSSPAKIGIRQPCFNPRSPRGERPFTITQPSVTGTVSIHAPRVGSDTYSSA